MLFIWETHKAHCSLSRTAAPSWPRNRVADTAIRQPAGIAAVIAQKLPGSKDLAHFRNLSTVIETSLHRLVIGELGGVDQVVKSACGEKERVSQFVMEPQKCKEPKAKGFSMKGDAEQRLKFGEHRIVIEVSYYQATLD